MSIVTLFEMSNDETGHKKNGLKTIRPFFYNKVVGLPLGATVVFAGASPTNRLFGATDTRASGRALLGGGGAKDEFLFRRGLPHRRIRLADAQIAGFVANGINRAAELTSAP